MEGENECKRHIAAYFRKIALQKLQAKGNKYPPLYTTIAPQISAYSQYLSTYLHPTFAKEL